MRWLAALCIFTVGGVAGARPTGISGASGKSGFICNQCHSGGAAPTVQLTGPVTLAAGAQATYTFTITGGAAVAGGLDAALDDASLAAGAHLATISPLTKILDGEVTHTQPNDFASGALSFQFAVVAPGGARTMTLWVAGNSTNHDGSSSGDKAAGTMMTITVAGAADLSVVTNPPLPASDLAVTPTPSGRDLATPAGDPGSEGPPAGAPSPQQMMAAAQGGCSLAPAAPAPSMLALLMLALGYVAAAFALAAAFSRRARRPLAPPAPPTPSASASARARH
jgi:hypothetical protein